MLLVLMLVLLMLVLLVLLLMLLVLLVLLVLPMLICSRAAGDAGMRLRQGLVVLRLERRGS
jgi:hypothetical protein